MAIEMTDTEISRRLALAIGYERDDVQADSDWFPNEVRVYFDDSWHVFDHRDERTIFRIAARYKIFPQWNTQYNQWTIAKVAPRGSMPSIVLHDCPRTCIALAVIEASERGLL